MLRLGTKEISRLSSPQQEKMSSQQLKEMSKKLSCKSQRQTIISRLMARIRKQKQNRKTSLVNSRCRLQTRQKGRVTQMRLTTITAG